MPSTTETRMLTRPEGSIAYDVSGHGPLVVCLPGIGELRGSYRFTAPALVHAGFRVATMDLRGHGDSDATFSSYDDVAAGQDALALIEELGGAPATILGNSMGAGAAVWAAAERPEAVAGIVLLGPFVRDAPVNPVMALAFRALMAGPWAPAVWNAYLPTLYPGRKPDDFDEHRARIRASMRQPGHRTAFSRTTRTTHAPSERRLGDVRAKALIVMGGADPDFRDPEAEARWIGERLDGEVLMVAGAGHYPHAERPDVVVDAIVRFLGTVQQHA
ncbi:alpha/beta hydrolase [Demequina sp.]|uniref:alpha/beta fold hydrolase n=1 Tax=Demequina sp. TaxID=2050685 RepID=UPI0025CC7A59|nr:alpha/beta hydrolase [Demequina sp.]